MDSCLFNKSPGELSNHYHHGVNFATEITKFGSGKLSRNVVVCTEWHSARWTWMCAHEHEFAFRRKSKWRPMPSFVLLPWRKKKTKTKKPPDRKWLLEVFSCLAGMQCPMPSELQRTYNPPVSSTGSHTLTNMASGCASFSQTTYLTISKKSLLWCKWRKVSWTKQRMLFYVPYLLT